MQTPLPGRVHRPTTLGQCVSCALALAGDGAYSPVRDRLQLGEERPRLAVPTVRTAPVVERCYGLESLLQRASRLPGEL